MPISTIGSKLKNFERETPKEQGMCTLCKQHRGLDLCLENNCLKRITNVKIVDEENVNYFSNKLKETDLTYYNLKIE